MSAEKHQRLKTQEGKHVRILLKYLPSFQKILTRASWARGGFLYSLTLRDMTCTKLSSFLFEPRKLLATVTSNNKDLCSVIPSSSCLLWTCHLLPLMPHNPSANPYSSSPFPACAFFLQQRTCWVCRAWLLFLSGKVGVVIVFIYYTSQNGSQGFA